MMELNHAEQMALFEGLMDAEYRRLRVTVTTAKSGRKWSGGRLCYL